MLQRMLLLQFNAARTMRCHHLKKRQLHNWAAQYTKQERISIEKYWKDKFFKKIKSPCSERKIPKSNKKKFYCLSMFPYPSGRLHMGHVRVYTISDTFATYNRMRGYDVIHPMGWDAFGLPAENAAFERGLDPEEWTTSNILNMKEQLVSLNLFFDWNREYATSNPDYYKGTQQLFLWLMEEGLAYQEKAIVNWDPVDKTVLANEQVDEEGRSWRSGAHVEKKYLKQWFLKTTAYAESLIETLPEINENVGVKAIQKDWIGNIDGCFLNLQLNFRDSVVPLKVFCFHPAGVYGASHVKLCQENLPSIRELILESGNLEDDFKFSTKEDIIEDCFVVNPFNNSKLPVLIQNINNDMPHNVLAIPCFEEKSKIDAKHHNFIFEKVLTDDGKLINSGNISNMKIKETTDIILNQAKEMKILDGNMTSSKLVDWLISRQRYWGTPIPVIHCPQHGAVGVRESDLPVTLPHVSQVNMKDGKSPLESATDWLNTTCPICNAPSKRETDTMDTFVDSSWYFLRFLDPQNKTSPFSKDVVLKNMPVDLYIGGKEHAVLHLYYARFINHFLHKKGLVPSKEPFKKLLSQGIIKGKTYQVKSNKKYVPELEVDTTNENYPVLKSTNEPVITFFEKMSKSKFNGVDPETFINEHGISLTRLFILYAASPHEDILWDTKTDVIPGMMRWQVRTWTIITKLMNNRHAVGKEQLQAIILNEKDLKQEKYLCNFTNKTIRKVTNHFEIDCVISAAITELLTLTKQLYRAPESVIQSSKDFEVCVSALIKMLFPFTPHFASQLWKGFTNLPYHLSQEIYPEDLFKVSWPEEIDVGKCFVDDKKIFVKIKGRNYAIIDASNKDLTEDEIKEQILQIPKIQRKIENKSYTFTFHNNKPVVDIRLRNK